MDNFIEKNGKKIPIRKIVIDLSEGEGAEEVALVESPAINNNFIAFSDKKPFRFEADKDKQELWGPFMIPDMPIYRRDADGTEYYVTFDNKSIEDCMTLFMRKPVFNFEHSNRKVKASLLEAWIVESPDKSEKKGFKLPDGTMFGRVKIEDESFWNDYVRSGLVKGFSVEGFMGMMSKKFDSEKENKAVIAAEQDKTQKMKKNTFSVENLKKVKFATHDVAGSEMKLEVEGELKEGSSVALVDSEGNYFDVPDGEVYLADGTGVYVQAGKIVKVESKEQDITPEVSSTELAMEDWKTAFDALKAEIITVIADIDERVKVLESGPTEEEKVKEAAKEEEYKSVLTELSNLKKKFEAHTPKVDQKVPVIDAKLQDINERAERLKSLRTK